MALVALTVAGFFAVSSQPAPADECYTFVNSTSTTASISHTGGTLTLPPNASVALCFDPNITETITTDDQHWIAGGYGGPSVNGTLGSLFIGDYHLAAPPGTYHLVARTSAGTSVSQASPPGRPASPVYESDALYVREADQGFNRDRATAFDPSPSDFNMLCKQASWEDDDRAWAGPGFSFKGEMQIVLCRWTASRFTVHVNDDRPSPFANYLAFDFYDETSHNVYVYVGTVLIPNRLMNETALVPTLPLDFVTRATTVIRQYPFPFALP